MAQFAVNFVRINELFCVFEQCQMVLLFGVWYLGALCIQDVLHYAALRYLCYVPRPLVS